MSYQLVLGTPLLGERLLRHLPQVVSRGLQADAVSTDAFSEADLAAFREPLREPARARASSLYYRTFLLAEAPRLLRYRSARLTVPTLLLSGTQDSALTTRMLSGYEDHADDMRVELV